LPAPTPIPSSPWVPPQSPLQFSTIRGPHSLLSAIGASIGLSEPFRCQRGGRRVFAICKAGFGSCARVPICVELILGTEIIIHKNTIHSLLASSSDKLLLDPMSRENFFDLCCMDFTTSAAQSNPVKGINASACTIDTIATRMDEFRYQFSTSNGESSLATNISSGKTFSRRYLPQGTEGTIRRCGDFTRSAMICQ